MKSKSHPNDLVIMLSCIQKCGRHVLECFVLGNEVCISLPCKLPVRMNDLVYEVDDEE